MGVPARGKSRQWAVFGRRIVIRHRQVVEVTEKNVVLCVGASDGAAVGQELTAYKVVRTPVIGDGKHAVSWSRVETGTVRISGLFDEHCANATITTGSVDLHGIVELQRD